jgi:hypothetical protein
MRRHAAVSVGDHEYMRAEATGIMRLWTVTPETAFVNPALSDSGDRSEGFIR